MLFYHSGHWTFGVICTTKDCEKIFEFGNIMPKIPQSFFWWIQCIVVEDMWLLCFLWFICSRDIQLNSCEFFDTCLSVTALMNFLASPARKAQ